MPPLADRPYLAPTLDPQLDGAARAYLGSPEGVRLDGNAIKVSSIFKWYGDDFTAQYAARVPGSRDARERGILGAVATFGPPAAATQAGERSAQIVYLAYNWSLNDGNR